MLSKIREMCCAAWAFPPNSNDYQLNITAGTTVAGRVYPPLGCGA